ncbi:hypothetical protein ACIBI4_06235 [Streptomyces sp. NPDC050418]|uniref:hypothetical protein n=1 Tax=Streptomyces sp. NPDC050418 TaxID=3365612 RepID=UPI0037A49C65
MSRIKQWLKSAATLTDTFYCVYPGCGKAFPTYDRAVTCHASHPEVTPWPSSP